MGLDAFFIVKFKEDTPKEIYEKFDLFHDDGYYDNNDIFKGYREVAYLRSCWDFQDYLQSVCGEQLTFDKYYFHVSEDEIKTVYFDLWNAKIKYDVPRDDDGTEWFWDDVFDCDFASTLGEIYIEEAQVFDLTRNLEYIDDIIYYASW